MCIEVIQVYRKIKTEVVLFMQVLINWLIFKCMYLARNWPNTINICTRISSIFNLDIYVFGISITINFNIIDAHMIVLCEI